MHLFVNDAISEKINIPAGLAQGTCISPILYALFVADIPVDANTQLALYADDTAIYTAAKHSNSIINRLNSSLTKLQQYFKKWKIKVNPTKTQAIIFPYNNKRQRIPSTALRSEQNVIELSKSINYLGITFDKRHSANTYQTLSTKRTDVTEHSTHCLLQNRICHLQTNHLYLLR